MEVPVVLSTTSSNFSQNYYAHAETIKESFLFYESHLETSSIVNAFEMMQSFYPRYLFDWNNNLATL